MSAGLSRMDLFTHPARAAHAVFPWHLRPANGSVTRKTIRMTGVSGMRKGGTMNHRVLLVIGEEDGWRVQLDGVDIVSFFGPYAREWAVREQEELEQLLDARSSSGDP